MGWPRTFIVGLAIFAASSPVATRVATAADLVTQDGRVAVSPGVAVLFLALAFAWVFGLGVTALVVSEAIWPTGSTPNPLQLVARGGRRCRVAVRRPSGTRIVQLPQ